MAAAGPKLDDIFKGVVNAGVVVRVIASFRSFLSPHFYLNTGVTALPNVDYTFDVDVCDGFERVRILSGFCWEHGITHT